MFAIAVSSPRDPAQHVPHVGRRREVLWCTDKRSLSRPSFSQQVFRSAEERRMSLEQSATRHYELGSLEAAILEALPRVGKDSEKPVHGDLPPPCPSPKSAAC
jgi:hypothetical protein